MKKPQHRRVGFTRAITSYSQNLVFNEIDENINMSLVILKTIHNIMMSSINIGNPLTRWKELTTFMIQKVPNA
jgi:hypothetical protein